MWNVSFLPSQNICSHGESNAEGSEMTSGPSVYGTHADNYSQKKRHYHLCHSRRANAMRGLNGIKRCSSRISKCLIRSDSLKKKKRECLYCIIKSVKDCMLPTQIQMSIEKLAHILWQDWQQSLHLTSERARMAPGASAPFLRWGKHTQTRPDWSDHRWKTRWWHHKIKHERKKKKIKWSFSHKIYYFA